MSDGGVHHSYLDGVLTAVNENNPPPLNDGDSTWSIGRQGAYTDLTNLVEVSMVLE